MRTTAYIATPKDEYLTLIPSLAQDESLADTVGEDELHEIINGSDMPFEFVDRLVDEDDKNVDDEFYSWDSWIKNAPNLLKVMHLPTGDREIWFESEEDKKAWFAPLFSEYQKQARRIAEITEENFHRQPSFGEDPVFWLQNAFSRQYSGVVVTVGRRGTHYVESPMDFLRGLKPEEHFVVSAPWIYKE